MCSHKFYEMIKSHLKAFGWIWLSLVDVTNMTKTMGVWKTAGKYIFIYRALF